MLDFKQTMNRMKQNSVIEYRCETSGLLGFNVKEK